ncbi:cysteine desulfurase family protein [Paenibacillus beijingensis]|uniref:cysteine desulfurase n=1 Tax=Paenibacillus beijingensis TaxID=1126833 RepID=A0A0D5NLV3_9BACL|nr:cysteine desulfurase family protein [Paenibacillus beijingensis]AJY76110.1 cysteine desulfurase [Paenibacillus beijingensis]
MERFYFDHAATTPLHPEAAAAMLDVMQGPPGNASSIHSFGREARRVVNAARERIAGTLGCRPDEVIFTSGGTESNNTALTGVMAALRRSGKNHIVTTAIEHHAVLNVCEKLEREGVKVTYVPVDSAGRVSADDIAGAIGPDTGVVSVMYGNNETGTIQPIEEIGLAAEAAGVLLHVDAVQAYGKVAIDLQQLPVHMLTVSSHKINGPQGIGALYVKKGTPYYPLLFGGLQERKRRGGTENVAGIAGFGKAAEICAAELESRKLLWDKLRLYWIERMRRAAGDDISINGHELYRLPHIVNISFTGIDTESMLMNLDLAGIAASGGSACTAGALEPSHVLRAMGVPDSLLQSAVRFSFGLGNTLEELEQAAGKVETFLRRVRTTK